MPKLIQSHLGIRLKKSEISITQIKAEIALKCEENV